MSRTVIAVIIACAFPAAAFAFPRGSYEPAQVVDRSELIVVAHLDPTSVIDIDVGGQTIHRAKLVIAETLKGKAEAREIPILIHYGLGLAVDGKMSNAHMTFDLDGTFAKRAMQLFDSGGARGRVIADDVAQDRMWFLRRLGGARGEKRGIGDLGIVDPEDVVTLARRPFYAMYLSADPEAAVRAYAATHRDPEATRYLDHIEIQRIVKLPDHKQRVDQLMPYFLRGSLWGLDNEANDGLAAAGADVTGPKLAAVFAKATPSTRLDIIAIWRETKFRGAVDPLIDLLRASDAYWEQQSHRVDWWEHGPDAAITKDREDRAGEVYEAVTALDSIGDPRAKPALELTRKRWKMMPGDYPQLVEACEHALATLH